MLDKIDLSKRLSKSEYKSLIADIELMMGDQQRRAKEAGIPVIILFEGWDAAGKGTLINRLMMTYDPRGFNVYPTHPPTDDERLRPFLWRFWLKIPEKGRIAIFDRSWYRRVLIDRADKITKKKEMETSYNEINAFERQLNDDGYLVIKILLHVSRKTQKRRFKNLEKNSATSWKVTKDDWKHFKQYDKYLKLFEDMLAKTDTSYAPWTIVESEDKRFATVKVFETVFKVIENRLNTQKEGRRKKSAKPQAMKIQLPEMTSSILDGVDVSPSLDREKYVELLIQYQKRLRELEHQVYVRRLPVVIVYEGWDAAGKGGNIKRVVKNLDPRGYEVIPIMAPNDVEQAHHYLWRFWTKIPKAGHIAVFDRSWYGRLLVERIEGLCPEGEWKRAYQEINEMEEHLCNFGTVLIKFWLHIDKEEQLKRFNARKENTYKHWKITDEDWRNREKWDEYKLAVDEMLFRTGTSHAPWFIIESNSKLHARIKAMKTIIDSIEKKL